MFLKYNIYTGSHNTFYYLCFIHILDIMLITGRIV